MKVQIALSMGDPAGVGPELCCRVASDPLLQHEADITVFASTIILERVASTLGLPMPQRVVECCANFVTEMQALVPGAISRSAGAAALACLEAATQSCRSGQHQALVTAPIHKEAAQLAGFAHPGHIEYLAASCADAQGTIPEVAMALHGPGLTVVLASIHCSLREAAERLNSAAICHVGRLLHKALQQRLQRQPRLACLGLNPHAGEGGLFGDEEATIISPALAQLASEGISVHGPLAPDTAFTPAMRAQFDGYICCYHDQGLIPFKMLHFHDGVNWTLGLPIIRTSPDHGTAFDIAWQGSADPTSLSAALRLAQSLTSNKKFSL